MKDIKTINEPNNENLAFEVGKWYYDAHMDMYFQVGKIYVNHYNRRYAGNESVDILSIPLSDTDGIVMKDIESKIESLQGIIMGWPERMQDVVAELLSLTLTLQVNKLQKNIDNLQNKIDKLLKNKFNTKTKGRR